MRSSRLTVETEGVLPLPTAVCEALGLQPGDILAVEVLWGSFVLEAYRGLVANAWRYMDASALQGFVARFLSRPLTALEPGGLVRIPPEVFPLLPGTDLSLAADPQSHILHLYETS